jgi:hypothetical protein
MIQIHGEPNEAPDYGADSLSLSANNAANAALAVPQVWEGGLKLAGGVATTGAAVATRVIPATAGIGMGAAGIAMGLAGGAVTTAATIGGSLFGRADNAIAQLGKLAMLGGAATTAVGGGALVGAVTHPWTATLLTTAIGAATALAIPTAAALTYSTGAAMMMRHAPGLAVDAAKVGAGAVASVLKHPWLTMGVVGVGGGAWLASRAPNTPSKQFQSEGIVDMQGGTSEYSSPRSLMNKIGATGDVTLGLHNRR